MSDNKKNQSKDVSDVSTHPNENQKKKKIVNKHSEGAADETDNDTTGESINASKKNRKRRKVLWKVFVGVVLFFGAFQLAVIYEKKTGGSSKTKDSEEIMEYLTGEEVGIHTGDLAPNMDLVDMETYEVKQLADFKGKTILLNFWASWCEPCKLEMPDVERIYQEYKDEVAVISLNMTTHEKSDKNPLRFLAENNLTFPVYQDVGGMNSQLYQVKPIPTTFIINADGMITGVYPHYLTYEQMVEAIEFAEFTMEYKKNKSK